MSGYQLDAIVREIRHLQKGYIEGRVTVRELVERVHIETAPLSRDDVDLVWERIQRGGSNV